MRGWHCVHDNTRMNPMGPSEHFELGEIPECFVILESQFKVSNASSCSYMHYQNWLFVLDESAKVLQMFIAKC